MGTASWGRRSCPRRRLGWTLLRRGPRWLPGCRGSLGRRGGGLETGRAAETLEWSWGESQWSWWAGRMMEFNLPFPQKDQRKEGASVSDRALRFLEALRPGLGRGRPSLVTGTFLPAPIGPLLPPIHHLSLVGNFAGRMQMGEGGLESLLPLGSRLNLTSSHPL